MDGKHHDIDNLFRNAFESHEVVPSSDLWGKIEQELPLTETDRLFKRTFTNYEVDPSPEVWLRIKRRLPLSLVLRKHLTRLSKVAAILVIGMLTYVFFESNSFFQAENKPNTIVVVEEDSTLIEDAPNVIAQQQVVEEIIETKTEPTLPPVHNQPIVRSEHVPVTEISDDVPGNASEYEMETDDPSNIIQNPVADNLFLKSGNTTKGGDAVYVELNIDNIAEHVEKGGSTRLSSEDLIKGEHKLTQAEIDSITLKRLQKLQKENGNERIAPLKGKRMEDAVTIHIAALDSHWEEEAEESSRPQTPVSPRLYFSFAGKDDDAFDNVGKSILGRSNRQKAWTSAVLEFKGIYLSSHVELNNTWAFNHTFKNQFTTMADSKTDYAVDFGKAFGLDVGFQFAPKWAFQSGIRYSSQGQRYRELSSLDKKVTTMRLNYLSIPLTFKHRLNKISGRKPATLSYVFGTQLSFLQGAPTLNTTSFKEGTTDAPEIDETLVAQNELGLVVGVDYDLFLNRNSSWTIGARASVGTDMNTMFASTPNTYNVLIGVRTAFNFRLMNNN